MTTLEETYADILDGPIREVLALAAAFVQLADEIKIEVDAGEYVDPAVESFLCSVAELTLELLGED